MTWHRPAESIANQPISPETAGWTYTGLALYHLEPNATIDIVLAGDECVLVPLVGSLRVTANDKTFELVGRPDVFAGPTDLCYLPPGPGATISSPAGGEVAVCTARSERGGPPVYYPAESVAIEIRGAGDGTRQVNHLLGADVVGPERLIVVEVITPDGNWSSYPPHKHDEATESECPLEEIYYFRFNRPGAFGLHRAYTANREIDETVAVHHGDAFLVPRGYHGPSAAAPGYPMYYLNVMAGPDPRAWQVSTDADHSWLWELWATEAPDRRLPWRPEIGL
ncbi:MAG TPA: 5-deoxy-glucuronate isomerase [Acidimicrobiia bacterium]|nr:5-deoxy-glucuronate isomerase [Acidimicrobiia bacterium]